MPIRIVTDTSCDLPDEILIKHQIDMIPLKVTFADGETYLDRLELSRSYSYKKWLLLVIFPKRLHLIPVLL